MIEFVQSLVFAIFAGAVVGLPLGPTGSYCNALALHGRLREALMGAAGTACGLAIWGGLAVAGVRFAGSWLEGCQGVFSLIAACVLYFVAFRIWIDSGGSVSRSERSSWTSALLCFGIVMSNPSGFVVFVLLFAGVSSTETDSTVVDSVAFPLGVWLGCFFAFFASIIFLARARTRLRTHVRTRIIKGLAVLVSGLATLLLVRAFGHLLL